MQRAIVLVALLFASTSIAATEHVLTANPRIIGPTAEVYTRQEIDAGVTRIDGRIDSTNAKLDQTATDLAAKLDGRIATTETALRKDVVQAINDIPQRVLEAAVAQELKAAILQELRQQLDQLRSDLQRQIDELKIAPD